MLSDVDLERDITTIKQVIVIRKDLKMRRGKEIAQGAHASMAFLSHAFRNGEQLQPAQKAWLDGVFAKVTVQVDSEVALREVEQKAKEAGLTVHLIEDCGRTEFGGVKTATCLAVGPDDSAKIDLVTGHLKLY